jgi:hypothetical protein
MAQISRLVTILVALFAILVAPFASAQDRDLFWEHCHGSD